MSIFSKKNILSKEIRSKNIYWALYVALIWGFFLSMRIIEDGFSSVEAGPTSTTLLLISLGIVVVSCILFIFINPIGWCMLTAVHIIQAGNSIVGIFGVLINATLDGEHIIGMARSGVGTALGIIMIVYLFQPFIRELYSLTKKDQIARRKSVSSN